jgi:hypothetical protein
MLMATGRPASNVGTMYESSRRATFWRSTEPLLATSRVA